MKTCKVCGRECNKLTSGMCNKHYRQFRKYGEVLDNNPRTIKDPNEIVEYEDYAEIIIYNKQCEEIARTLIDLDDVDKVKSHKWHLKENDYVCSGGILLHRLIMAPDDDMVVDHINHDKLDNRKDNLRICTQQQNMMNNKIRKNNTSGVTGVAWHKEKNKWRSVIMVNHKQIHIGYYSDIDDAIEARRNAEIEYFGEYRNER